MSDIRRQFISRVIIQTKGLFFSILKISCSKVFENISSKKKVTELFFSNVENLLLFFKVRGVQITDLLRKLFVD